MVAGIFGCSDMFAIKRNIMVTYLVYIYIYIERERERVCVCVCTTATKWQ